MIGRFIKSNRTDRYNSALDALRTNVMIADEDLNITYMNPSLYEFMKEAELDLRVELPRFRLNALIGSNIDIFHKDPSHQRRMLQALRNPYSATIRVGPRIFDLLVTPLLSNSRPSGYVVEWSDAKERLLNLDYAGQISAIGRSQAMVEFSIEGKIVGANRIFLDMMGYELHELLDQDDNIFIDTDQQLEQEHVDLWKQLVFGEFQSGQFKRMHKNGNAVWIEGTYNPILDVHGQICKIVQFSSDATDQVKLLDNLKVLIDRNFFEIDEAVMLSATEAEQAEQAATHTSSSVQSVAAAAEELASSINEISASMSNARQISDEAQEQLKAAGELTQKLTSTTDSMSSVINMISSIAGQINLLALNATIEAARAGAAGRGFAVVAAEVKNLATQAARATEQIESQITNAQGVSAQVAQNLHGILRSVEAVRSHVTATATSVEEQSAVTHDMSHTMQEAAGRVNIITKSIAEISRSVSRVSETVGNTKAAAIILSR